MELYEPHQFVYPADTVLVRGADMTVCVATIGDNMIFGAADRMLTAGDVQFTPQSPKVFPLTSSIVLMVSGDMALQAELVESLRSHVGVVLRGMDEPRWLTVKEVAGWYAELYQQLRAQSIEANLLRPLGLTLISYLDRQGSLSPALVEKLAREMLSHTLPSSSALLVGIDDTGPHLYVVIDGEITCRDLVGFAAIGNGANHANSYLMFSRHGRGADAAVALLRTFTAKKRSEVAPGVGTETDMYVIGPNPGTYKQLASHLEGKVEAIYRKSAKRHAEADSKAEGEIGEFVQKLARTIEGQAKQSVPEVEHREAPPAAEDARLENAAAAPTTDEPERLVTNTAAESVGPPATTLN